MPSLTITLEPLPIVLICSIPALLFVLYHKVFHRKNRH